ncbi:3-hydroxyacyl-CoA dehydrogenase NAD-binding domain-containing protein [Aureitalea marina]|uniref:3-hydroxybutyryl-CoA dehydrogenase n=1 Tax=Aureitalea marina TaxID=930804 RepID=A0A2S7KQX9_9FLAO|nr:3-hydroxyacyl-CoA dehydrogenase NAD-binding domain-containing protein [Aureitalea marina]PQB05032.1 3-hydroxybutyryl-CoA dehydrogenase [Aureitalea marina]
MIEKVGIIGSGTMGAGIAQVAATAGHQVVLYDTNQDALTRAEQSLQNILDRLVAKRRIQREERDAIWSRITMSDQMVSLSGSDLVIEAIVEDLSVKQSVFRELEAIVGKKTILASNTSSLSIASIAAALNRPKRCIGIHFFNPAPLMKLVEVIPAVQTSNKTQQLVEETIKQWGKVVAIAKDTPGFIVNRVARPFYGEALRIYDEGIANFATIDWAVKSIGGFRMGPFELMDFIGNDVNYKVTETVFKSFYYDPRYKPSFTQKRLSEAGYLGRKSGKGYYDYGEDAPEKVIAEDVALAHRIFDRILVMLINEAADALHLNIASATDIDLAMTCGVNYPKGLLAWADEKTIDWCVSRMDDLYAEYHEDRYRCSPLLRRMQKNQETFYL